MKRIFALILLLLILPLASCAKEKSMSELLSYQQHDFTAQITFSLGGKGFSADIEKRGEHLSLTFTAPEELSSFVLVRENGKDTLSVHGMSAALSSGERELFTAAAILPLFSVEEKGIWKITKENIAGIELYLCRRDGMSIYIDKSSLLPIKITSGELSIDIIKFDIKNVEL